MAGHNHKWRPITAAALEQIVEDDLTECSPAERTLFDAHRVPFYSVPLRRHGNIESALVVAHFGKRVLYFDDVEEGFALSTLDDTGAIREADCSQFELRHVLNKLEQ